MPRIRVKGHEVHTTQDQQRLYARFYHIMENAKDADEFSWRMEGMLFWWLQQMLESCNGDVKQVMQVLVEALNHVGIQTAAVGAKVEAEETVQ